MILRFWYVIISLSYYTIVEFADYVKKVKPYGIGFAFDSQDEFDYIINLICDFIGSINLIAKHNKAFDLSLLEKCTELVSIQMYWNTKQEILWDVKKNKKLKTFEIMDYYKVSDLSDFRGSTVEYLAFYGCNGIKNVYFEGTVKEWAEVVVQSGNDYLKNANVYLDRKYNIYINKFAALKSGKNGES